MGAKAARPVLQAVCETLGIAALSPVEWPVEPQWWLHDNADRLSARPAGVRALPPLGSITLTINPHTTAFTQRKRGAPAIPHTCRVLPIRCGDIDVQIEYFVRLSEAAFARCLISLIARFRRLTELACQPRRRNAGAYQISATARPAARSSRRRASRTDTPRCSGRSRQARL